MKVRIKKGTAPVKIRPKKYKPYFNTVAVTFKTYNDSLAKADLLFEAFSTERMEAQRQALNKLRERLKNLHLGSFVDQLDWQDSYDYPIKYANVA